MNELGNIKIDKWLWLAYPLLVVGLIMFSVSYFLSVGFFDFQALSNRQDEVAAEEKVAKQLQVKLAQVQSLDGEAAKEDLKLLVSAMPYAKKAWLLVAQVQQAAAASESGVQLVSYRGDVGDVKEASEGAKQVKEVSGNEMVLKVEYLVDDFKNLENLFKYFSSVRPLLRVRKVEFLVTRLVVTVEGAWATWKTEIRDVATPLPEYAADLTQIKPQLIEKDDMEAVLSN